MASDLIYAFRVTRLPLLDSDGATLGRIEDIVLAPSYGDDPPSVLGFVASSQRRRIFVNAHRIATLDTEGARLRSAAIDLNHFRKRPGELLVTEDVLDKRVGAEHVNDLALEGSPGKDVGVGGRRSCARHPLGPPASQAHGPSRRLGRGEVALRHDPGRRRGRRPS